MSLFALFLIVALPLYAAMNAYAFRKIVRAFPQPAFLRPVLLWGFVILFIAPFVGRLFDHDGHAWLARTINLPAYLWTAWIFWSVLIGLVLDLLALIQRMIRRPSAAVRERSRTHRARRQLAITGALLVLATVWGLAEAAYPRVRSLTFDSPKLATGCPPLRIVQVSDVHLSTFRGARWSRYVVSRVAALNPDVLVSTGDLIDSSLHNIGSQADDWATLHPPFGKYAIMGNHDYYTGLANAVAFHQRAGFRLLRGEGADIDRRLYLYGVDDHAGLEMKVPCFNDESVLSQSGHPDRFTILLKHQPLLNPVACEGYDLQLSGHTHGGQIFPFHVLIRVLYPVNHGLRTVGAHSQLYVSRGTGTWGPPLRLFAPPEITVITLRPAANAPR